MEERTYTCCICKEQFNGWGNNPWPIANDEGSICCDLCNMAYVIPQRLKLLKEKREGI